MNYNFHPQARQEVENALAYYDNIDSTLGDDLLDEVDRTIERIVKFPEAWAKLSRNTRRCRMKRFPYGIVYRIEDNKIAIVAVMHLQQEPDYWTDRS